MTSVDKISVYSKVISAREALRESPELQSRCDLKFLCDPNPEDAVSPVVGAVVMWPRWEQQPTWHQTNWNQWRQAR